MKWINFCIVLFLLVSLFASCNKPEEMTGDSNMQVFDVIELDDLTDEGLIDFFPVDKYIMFDTVTYIDTLGTIKKFAIDKLVIDEASGYILPSNDTVRFVQRIYRFNLVPQDEYEIGYSIRIANSYSGSDFKVRLTANSYSGLNGFGVVNQITNDFRDSLQVTIAGKDFSNVSIIKNIHDESQFAYREYYVNPSCGFIGFLGRNNKEYAVHEFY